MSLPRPRTVSFRDDVLYPMARAAGFDPQQNFQATEAATMIDTINTRMRYAWEFYPWPELQITEERAFRQVWNAVLNYAATTDEVYYLPTQQYYRALVDTAPGELPTDAAKWEQISLLDRYLAYEQFGKRAIGKIVAITNMNPRTYRWAALNYTTNPSGYGIDLSIMAVGPTVWVTYTPIPPAFTAETYDAATAYLKDALVYSGETGECYRALRDSTGEPLSSGTYWLMQEMPYLLSEYIQTGEAPLLYKQVDNMLEQGARHRYGRNGMRQQYPAIGFGPTMPWLVEVPIQV